MDAKTARIRALNDELRQHLTGGTAVVTPGVAALGPAAVERIVKTIAVFDDFCRANDPYEEHDFGSFEAGACIPQAHCGSQRTSPGRGRPRLCWPHSGRSCDRFPQGLICR